MRVRPSKVITGVPMVMSTAAVGKDNFENPLLVKNVRNEVYLADATVIAPIAFS